MLYTLADRFLAVEIKAGSTVSKSFFRGLNRLTELLPEQVAGRMLVHDGPESHDRSGARVTRPLDFVRELEVMADRVFSG